MSTTESAITVDLDAIPGADDGKKSVQMPNGERKGADDVEIKVETAQPEAKKPAEAKPDAQTTAKPTLSPEEGLKKLQKQLNDEREARLAAESRERQAIAEATQAKTRVQSSELDMVKSGISALTTANDALEEKLAGAMAGQDFAAAAKVQREISSNEAKLVELERAKTNMEKAPKPEARQQLDAVEQLAGQLAPKSAAWVRQHPEYAREPAKYRRMLRAHEDAMDEGHEPESPEYFAYVEDRLGVTHSRQETISVDVDPTAETAKPSTSRPSRQTAPPSAPVSRSGNGTGGSGRNIVTLTPEQVEMAEMMKMTPEEYARQMVALKAEGKLN